MGGDTLQSGVVAGAENPAPGRLATWEEDQEFILGLYNWSVKVFTQEKWKQG